MADSRDIIVEKDDVDCRLSTWITRNNKRLNFNSVNTLCRKGLVKVNVPCGPINNIKQVFEDKQVKSRKMIISMNHSKSKNKKIKLIANPMNFSESKILYKKAPPKLGQDTIKVLQKFLKLNNKDLLDLKKKKII